MPKYRSREIFEAVQFDPANWYSRVLKVAGTERFIFECDPKRMEKFQEIFPGDYIVTSHDGLMTWKVPREKFEAAYEQIESDA